MAGAHAVDRGIDIAQSRAREDRGTARRAGGLTRCFPCGALQFEGLARLGDLLVGGRDKLAHVRRVNGHAADSQSKAAEGQRVPSADHSPSTLTRPGRFRELDRELIRDSTRTVPVAPAITGTWHSDGHSTGRHGAAFGSTRRNAHRT